MALQRSKHARMSGLSSISVVPRAPTFAAWAGVFVDGRSLLPILDDPSVPWRRSFLIQRLVLEADERLEPANALAIRTERQTYIAFNNGEREMYRSDPRPGSSLLCCWVKAG
jgi:hypothetical protein